MSVNRWYVSTPGERAAGLSSLSAEVDLPMPDPSTKEEIAFVRDRLRQCFAAIWGTPDRLVHVLTDEDIRERDEAEKELGP